MKCFTPREAKVVGQRAEGVLFIQQLGHVTCIMVTTQERSRRRFLVVVLRSCIRLVAQTTRYHVQMDQWSFSFLHADRSRISNDQQRGLPSSKVQTTLRKTKVNAWLCARSLLGWGKRHCIFRYESGRTSVNHCRMMRQHLSRKVSGCTTSQPQTRCAACVEVTLITQFVYTDLVLISLHWLPSKVVLCSFCLKVVCSCCFKSFYGFSCFMSSASLCFM